MGASLRRLPGGALKAAKWELVEDTLIRGLPESENGYAAAEQAFFHVFVQRLLYGERRPRERPFELYRYSHPVGATVEVEEKSRQWREELTIRNHWFYLMDDCSAMVVLELTAPKPVMWSSVLNAISYLRTAHYQHYKQEEDGRWTGGGAPDRVTVGTFGAHSSSVDRTSELQCVVTRKKPVLLDHWNDMLKPLTEQGIEVDAIGDYRMAVMALIGTLYPERLTDDEWFALAEADGAAFKPYSPSFVKTKLEESVYDRWWNKATPEEFGDRVVAGGLTLVRVLRMKPGPMPDWVKRVRNTWRRQYFQIFFLAHFQRAALMILQNKVGEATQFIPMSRGWRKFSQLRAKLEEIERDMAIFSSRFWFAEASPQVQGQDLFALLRSRIKLETLYLGVVEDKGLLTQWARTHYWDLINEWVVPAGVYLAIASVLAGPAGKWAGAALVNLFPDCGPLSTPEARETICLLIGVLSFGAMWLAVWRLFVWRTGK